MCVFSFLPKCPFSLIDASSRKERKRKEKKRKEKRKNAVKKLAPHIN